VSTWIADLSYGWPSLSGHELLSLADPPIGVIGYAGCDALDKNVSHDRLHDWLNAGLAVGLVIENGSRDLAEGAAVGAFHASKILAASQMLGYAWQSCVLFTVADFNETTNGDYAGTLAGWNTFAARVPVPGYYGDSDSIDYLYAHAPISPVVAWQSSSSSTS